MNRADLETVFAESQARTTTYTRALREIEDLELLILKGHLIVEELLETILQTFCRHPESLSGARLRFGQRAALVRSLVGDEIIANEYWDSILKLDRLRNELVHSLSAEKLEEKTSAFVLAVERDRSDGQKFPRPLHSKSTLEQAIHFLIGGLEALAVCFGSLAVARAEFTDDEKLALVHAFSFEPDLDG